MEGIRLPLSAKSGGLALSSKSSLAPTRPASAGRQPQQPPSASKLGRAGYARKQVDAALDPVMPVSCILDAPLKIFEL